MPKRELEGVVVSAKAAKTVVIKVFRKVRHSLYDKIIKLSKNYSAHNESFHLSVGDKVVIEESRPFSKTKTWIVKSLKS